MRIGKLALSSAALLALTAASALAATHNVQVAQGSSGNLTFTPSSISIPSGDTITFINANSGSGQFLHNAVSDDNGATFSSGAVAVGTWTFTTPALTASIAYHCTNHGTAGPGGGVAGSGMAGSITVTTPVTLQSFDVH